MLKNGGRRIVCTYLAQINLDEIEPTKLSKALDRWTEELSRELGDRWGPARKALNLFLRDASYNVWTRARYKFEAFESHLEVPLDGKVMKAIQRESGVALPTVAVKRLTPEVSTQYQNTAQSLAEKARTLRVHLDLKWSSVTGENDA